MIEIILDGARVNSLESFWDEVERSLISGASWGRNLDAFNDILRGGFGTPENGFTLIWEHSAKSRESLGYPETVRQLRQRLAWCQAENRDHVAREIGLAERGIGPTVFDWLVEIIRCHGEGGNEAQSNVSLILN